MGCVMVASPFTGNSDGDAILTKISLGTNFGNNTYPRSVDCTINFGQQISGSLFQLCLYATFSRFLDIYTISSCD